MITKRIFHTYREDFPIIKKLKWLNVIQIPKGFDLNLLSKNLIFDLAKIDNQTKYYYIARHTDDPVPSKKLTPFKKRFSNLVNDMGKDSDFGIPTVWLAVYSDNLESIDLIETKLDEKNIKCFIDKDEPIRPDGSQTLTMKEAKAFPKFLHQVTQIGIDLLKIPSSIEKLNQLSPLLQWRSDIITNETNRKLEELKIYLIDNSEYYQNNIENNKTEQAEFWKNFRITHPGMSWAHFLFNICGIAP